MVAAVVVALLRATAMRSRVLPVRRCPRLALYVHRFAGRSAHISWTSKPGTMPHLNTLWRGQGHGVTPCLLPTRSVGPRVAFRHAACGHVSPRGSGTTDSDAHHAYAQTLQRAATLSRPDAKASLCPVCTRHRASQSASSGPARPDGADAPASPCGRHLQALLSAHRL